MIRAVVEREVLRPGEAFGDVFETFETAPLGAASIAQVHKATLTAKYGGPREVAVKVQRPRVEGKLLGDIAELKSLAKPLRNATPVDYYVVFSELEQQLADEFDFVKEAAAMQRIADLLGRDAATGARSAPPIVVPRCVPELSTRNVLVMDYLEGEPLARVKDSFSDAEKRVFGRQLLAALTESFGRCIFEARASLRAPPLADDARRGCSEARLPSSPSLPPYPDALSRRASSTPTRTRGTSSCSARARSASSTTARSSRSRGARARRSRA